MIFYSCITLPKAIIEIVSMNQEAGCNVWFGHHFNGDDDDQPCHRRPNPRPHECLVFFSERNRWVDGWCLLVSGILPDLERPLAQLVSSGSDFGGSRDRAPEKSVNGLIRPRSKDSTEHIFRDKFVGNPRCLQII